MIGQTISHYKILEKLGGGGMGVVYKAQDTNLKRIVALKFLPPELTRDPEAKERFIHEAQTASSLDHPNICTVHDIAETEEKQLFIVMACYEGETLKKKIEPGPLKLEQAIDIALQIAQGLAQAHKYEIVHRDIKPANVMVTVDGVAKIVDFGLARLSGLARLTKADSTVGTVGYMSPEQLRGDEADFRGDIFSFGVLLYEMLTGHLPFRGDHAAALTYAIANEPPVPLQSYIPDVGSELVHIINRTLEKDPNDRYQGMTEVLIDLRRLRKETTGVTPGIYQERRTRFFTTKRVIVIALGLLLAAVALFLLIVPQPRRMPLINPNSKTHQIPLPVKDVYYCALSPDGNWIAFAGKDASGTWDIYFMNSAGSEVRRITNDSLLFHTMVRDVSPDGAWALYSRPRVGTDGALVLDIALVQSMGGTSRILCVGAMPRFAPNGEKIFYFKGWPIAPSESGKYELWSIGLDGTDNHLVFTDSGFANTFPGVLSSSHSPSPDGKSIAWIKTDQDFSQDVITYHLESKEITRLTDVRGAMDEVFWTRNDFIIYSQYTKRSGNYDLWMCSPEVGEPLQLTRSSTGDEIYGALSVDGSKLLYFQYQVSRNIRIRNLETGNVSDVTSDDLNKLAVCISPDNRYVAYTPVASFSAVLNNWWGIMILDRRGEGSPRHLVSDEIVYVTTKSWSPDGKYIAYIRGRGRFNEKDKVCIVSSSGESPPRVIGEMGLIVGDQDPRLRWQDSQTLCWFHNMKTWMSSIENAKPTQFYQDSTNAFTIQNGKYVFFRDYRAGREGWWIDRLPSSAEIGQTSARKLLDPIENYLIPPRGEFMIYRLASGERFKMNLPEGKKQRLPYPYVMGEEWHSISHDGKSVVYLERVSNSKLIMWEDPFIWE